MNTTNDNPTQIPSGARPITPNTAGARPITPNTAGARPMGPNGPIPPGPGRPMMPVNAPNFRPGVGAKKNNNVLKAVAIGAGVVAGVGVGTVVTASVLNANDDTDIDNDALDFSDSTTEAGAEIGADLVPPADGTAPGTDTPTPQPEVRHVYHHHTHHHYVEVEEPGQVGPDGPQVDDPQIDVIEVGSMEVGGQMVDVAFIQVNGVDGVFIDFERDGNADLLWLDINGDGMMSEEEVMDTTDRVISMNTLAENQGGSVGVTELGLFSQEEMMAARYDEGLDDDDNLEYNPSDDDDDQAFNGDDDDNGDDNGDDDNVDVEEVDVEEVDVDTEEVDVENYTRGNIDNEVEIEAWEDDEHIYPEDPDMAIEDLAEANVDEVTPVDDIDTNPADDFAMNDTMPDPVDDFASDGTMDVVG